MDRFQSETYTASAPAHFRSEEAYLDWLANNQPEPVDAAVLSACCGAEIRIEIRESSTCPETGYRDEGGPFDMCAACGSEFEPMLQPVPVAQRMPLVSTDTLMRETQDVPKYQRMQGELFHSEVA